MAPIAASLIAPMASSLIQPVTSSLINAIPGKEQEGRILLLVASPLMMKVLRKGERRAGRGIFSSAPSFRWYQQY